MKSLNWKNYTIANMLFFGILLIMFREFFFNFETLLVTSDHLNSLGMRFIRDGFFLTQWDASKLGGIPTLDATFGDAYHPLVFLQSLFHPARALGYKFIITIQIAFAGGLFLFNYLSKSFKIGALVALLFALSPQFFSLVYPGHDGKMMVISALPFAFYGYLQFVKSDKKWGLIVLLLSLVWMILSSHIQLVYFSLWGLGFHSLLLNFPTLKSLKSKSPWIKQGLIAATLVLALGISFVQIYPPFQYTTTDSVRGTANKTTMGHAVSWSIHPEEAMSMVLPNFIGSLPIINKEEGKYQKTYWGRNSFKLNSDAIGTMLWLIGLWGLIANGIRSRESLFWITVVSVSLVYALGIHTGLFKVFFNIIPGVKNFRAPSMVLFWIPFALAYMGALGLPKLWNNKSVWVIRVPIIFSGILLISYIMLLNWETVLSGGGLFITGILFILLNIALAQKDEEKWVWRMDVDIWKNGNKPDIEEEFTVFNIFFSKIKREKWFYDIKLVFISIDIKKLCSILVLYIPFIVVALMFFNISLIEQPAIKGYFKDIDLGILLLNNSRALIYLIFSLSIIAVFTVAIKFLSIGKGILLIGVVALFELWVLNSPFIDTVNLKTYVNPSHPYIESIQKDMKKSGHKVDDYRLLAFSRDNALKPNAMPIFGMRNASGFHDNELATYQNFRMSGRTNNFTTSIENNPFLDIANVGYILIDQGKKPQIIKNSTAFPRVKLFATSEKVDDPIEALKSRKYNYKKTILHSDGVLLKDSSAKINGSAKIIKNPRGDEIVVEVKSEKEAILFLSENYHKYWTAKINGESKEIIKAFETFQAVVVPAGNSTVIFEYKSGAVEFSKKIVIISLILTILFSIWAFKKDKRKLIETTIA